MKALECGYENCGIINVGEMSAYADKLRERALKVPGSDKFYGRFYNFAEPCNNYPWAKSIVVCIVSYGHYIIPDHLTGLIGRHYLTDIRSNTECREYKASIKFEEYLRQLGLQVATDRMFGITSMRWAAGKAGLGIVRRNNFLYTKSGSWIHVEAFLTDCEMEYIHKVSEAPCPNDCDRCISACPTRSLSEPYTMNPSSCISSLTVWEEDLINSKYGKAMGKWIYGCDACQDACPYNAGKWKYTDKFPGLEALSGKLSLESIVLMDNDTLTELLSEKFFYITKERIGKWKDNALNAIRNNNGTR